MKKLLTILASLTMVASAGVTVVACGTQSDKNDNNNDNNNDNETVTDQQELMNEVVARAKSLIINDQLGLDQSLTSKSLIGSTKQTMIDDSNIDSMKTENVDLSGNVGTVSQLLDQILKQVSSSANLDDATIKTIESTITGTMDQAGQIIGIVLQFANTSTIASLLPGIGIIPNASSTIENVSKLLDAALKKVDTASIGQSIDPILQSLADLQNKDATDENGETKLADYSLSDMQNLLIVDIANIAGYASGDGSYIKLSKDNSADALTYLTSLLNNIKIGDDGSLLTDDEQTTNITTDQLIHSILQTVQILQDWISMFDTTESRAVEITDNSTSLFTTEEGKTDFDYIKNVYSNSKWGNGEFFGTLNFGSLLNNIKYHLADNKQDSDKVKELKMRKLLEILILSGDVNDGQCIFEFDESFNPKNWFIQKNQPTGLNPLFDNLIDSISNWGDDKIKDLISGMDDNASMIEMAWNIIDNTSAGFGWNLQLIKSNLSYMLYSVATGNDDAKIGLNLNLDASSIKDIVSLINMVAGTTINVDDVTGELAINAQIALPSFHDIYTGINVDNIINNFIDSISITLPGGLGLGKVDVADILKKLNIDGIPDLPEGLIYISLEGDITNQIQSILKMDQIQQIIKEKIEDPINNIIGENGEKLSLKNLINSPISQLAGSFSEDVASLISPHADAFVPEEYGQYSVADLINIVADGFETNDKDGKCKSDDDLKDYYMNFASLKQIVDVLTETNPYSSNTDSPTSLLQDIARDGSNGDINKIITELGYVSGNQKVYADSFMGSFIQTFIPAATATDNKIDLNSIGTLHDNLNSVINGVWTILSTLLQKGDYDAYIKALTTQSDSLFTNPEIKEVTYYGKTKDVKTMTIDVTFDLNGFTYNNNTYSGDKYKGNYEILVTKSPSNDVQYTFTSISKK